MPTLNLIIRILPLVILLSCTSKTSEQSASASRVPMEIADFYQDPKTDAVYSVSVKDSFKISTIIPATYHEDSAKHYPLVILLDGNAYFEPIASQLKLGTLTLGLPPVILTSVGYSNFWRMDSLRNRDYTYPPAPAADSMTISGGGQNFKQFLEKELIPSIRNTYRIDTTQILLVGHSLGGYFVLYAYLEGIAASTSITHYVAASPSLWYHDQYALTEQQRKIEDFNKSSMNLFLSWGSKEVQPHTPDSDFLRFSKRITSSGPRSRKGYTELGNLDHMEAAIPGMMKGLVFFLNPPSE